ncbi:MAG: hypothetical protein ACK55I_31065, partial [bacterium]
SKSSYFKNQINKMKQTYLFQKIKSEAKHTYLFQKMTLAKQNELGYTKTRQKGSKANWFILKLP